MLPQLPAAVRVFLCSRPTDMRKSFDGLFGMVREFLGQDPLSGHLFLFLNRRRDRAKILFWDRDGLVIWYKRLEAGSFQSLDPTPRGGADLGRRRPRTLGHRVGADLERGRPRHGSTSKALLPAARSPSLKIREAIE